MKVRNKFFGIKSIPNVMFLYGKTSYKDCKKIDYNLTKKEYDEAIADYERAVNKKAIKKPEKKIIVDKK